MVISARRFDTGVEAGESFFFHADTQGNVRDLRKSDGSLEQSYSYRAFGEQLDVPEHYGGQVPSQDTSTHYGGQEVPSVPAVEPRYGGQASGTGYSNDKNAYRFEGLYGYYTDSPSRTYVRARHYAPQQGRWISNDPLGFGGGDRNLYRYVSNNPVGAVDPSGLQGETWCNVNTGTVHVKINNNACDRLCTIAHEHIHKDDRAQCCRRAGRCVQKGFNDCARRYSAWQNATTHWSECRGYRMGLACRRAKSCSRNCACQKDGTCQAVGGIGNCDTCCIALCEGIAYDKERLFYCNKGSFRSSPPVPCPFSRSGGYNTGGGSW